MRILVTGATGGLGRNAVEYLLRQGIAVNATGRNTAIGKILSDEGADFSALDLAYAQPDQLFALLKEVDAVWHCAAMSSPWGAKQQFEANNIVATKNLLDAAGKAGVKCFVHVSTPSIYFDFCHRYDIDESFRAKVPVNEYARTKGLAEKIILAASPQFPSMRTLILRPRAIFGPYDQVLIPRLMSMLKAKNGRLPLPRGGQTTIDMTYVENVVHAMWLATNKSDLPSGIALNITNDEPAQIAGVLEKLFVSKLKLPMKIVNIPYPIVALAASVLEQLSKVTGKEPSLTKYSAGVLAFDMILNLDRAKAQLGYVPVVTLDEGIARTAAWLSKNG